METVKTVPGIRFLSFTSLSTAEIFAITINAIIIKSAISDEAEPSINQRISSGKGNLARNLLMLDLNIKA